MRTTTTGRSPLGRASVMVPILALGLFTGPAAAVDRAGPGVPVAGQEAGAPVPLGNWAVVVTFVNPAIPPERGLFSFTVGGTCLGTTTRAQNLSLGQWRPATGGFDFSFREFTYDDEEVWTGEVRVQQTGRMTSADSWTASGTGTAYDVAGNQVFQVETTTSGTRY
ncbi:hypothetical protein ACQPZF_26130 [Actinosynnema sp. CS-041913]|uniref:hypothetical protein n=1 Tax=Actinosynnema sp. CS-041913 TaxID=3239917 RepID=UPI003D919025